MLKKLYLILMVLLAFGFMSCSDGSDDDGSDTPSVTVTDTDIASVTGTYWGTLAFMGSSFVMSLDVSSDSVEIASDIMTMTYPVVKFSKDSSGDIAFSAYKTDAATASLTGTFTVTDSSVTCVATIVAMNASTDTLTLYENYAFEKGYYESALYGSYWGTWTVMSQSIPACLVLAKDSFILYSSSHSYKYSVVEYVYDETAGTVTVYSYADGTTADKGTSAKCYAIFSDIDNAKVGVVAMSKFADDFSVERGADYNGEYGTTE